MVTPVQAAAAMGAEHLAFEQIRRVGFDQPRLGAAGGLIENFLHRRELFPADDGLMGVPHHRPFLGVGIDLPVMSEWSYPRLKIAPCRQFGSSRTDDLVIAAHNYESHFGKLTSLTEGDSVTFTDMDGIVNEYVVNKVEVLDPHSVEEVEHSGYALVLYTCTYGGKTRVTVFCDRAS